MVAPTADKLPLRLSPVYQSKSNPSRYLIPVDETSPDEPVLNLEDQDFIDREVAEGALVLFEQPLEAKAGHWLMQFTMDGGPEILHPEAAVERLAHVSAQALRRAASSLRRGNRDMAEEYLAYAWRSADGNPLPLLALFALIRETAGPDRISALEEELKEYSEDDVQQALGSAPPELASIVELIRIVGAHSAQSRGSAAPKRKADHIGKTDASPRRDFLEAFRRRPSFLKSARSALAFAA